MTDILEKLRGGDRRSIGRANEVAIEVEKTPSLFGTIFNGLYDRDPILRMRSADVIEKVTQHRPDLLAGFTSKVISLLASTEQQEVCWHMAQIAPRIVCTPIEEHAIIKILKKYLLHESKLVRVSALEALALFSEKNDAIMHEIIEIIKAQIKTGSPAIQSRGRKLLNRLGEK